MNDLKTVLRSLINANSIKIGKSEVVVDVFFYLAYFVGIALFCVWTVWVISVVSEEDHRTQYDFGQTRSFLTKTKRLYYFRSRRGGGGGEAENKSDIFNIPL